MASAAALIGRVGCGIGALLLVFCPAVFGQDAPRCTAENPAPAVRAKRDSTIELLYIAAADCGYCRRWEANYLQGGKPNPSLDWMDVRFSMVDIGTFRARFGVEDAPSHLRPGMAKAMNAAGQSSLRGTPWFALFVNGEVRCHAFGITAFETLIQPAMRGALREKSLDTGS